MTARRLFVLPLLALLCLSAATARAQITVNRSVIEFGPDARVQDIEVRNGGENKVYLDLSVAEIVNPESESPTRVALDDPRSAAVLVSPRQLLVPPGGRKRVRVILREGASEVDRVFRLRIAPYTGKARLAAPGGDKKSSAIRVLVGYDLLLLARPADARPQLEVKRDEDTIEFRNKGNTNVLLRRLAQCEAGVDPDAADSGDRCVELSPNRLYAGETYRVTLPKRGPASRFPIKVWQAVGLENSSATF